MGWARRRRCECYAIKRATAVGSGCHWARNGTASLAFVRLTANRNSGVFAIDEGTVVAGDHVLIDHTRGRKNDGETGRGIDVKAGASLTLDAIRCSANHDRGLFVDGEGSRADISRLLMDGTLSQQSDLVGGWGVVVHNAGRLELKDARLTASRDAGLLVAGLGSEVTARRLLVDGTRSRKSNGVAGNGVGVWDRASLRLTGARISGNRNTGITVSGAGSWVLARNVLVDGTRSRQSDGLGGIGVNAE